MEKDISLGSVGGIKITLAGGKATLELSASEAILEGSVKVSGSASGSLDAGVLVDMLFAEIEAKSPAGIAPIEETVKAIVKSAVLAIV